MGRAEGIRPPSKWTRSRSNLATWDVPNHEWTPRGNFPQNHSAVAMISVIYILCQCFYAVTDRCFVVVINRELGHVVQLQSHQAKYHWAKKAWGGTKRDTLILLVSPILYATKSSMAIAHKGVTLKLTFHPSEWKMPSLHLFILLHFSVHYGWTFYFNRMFWPKSFLQEKSQNNTHKSIKVSDMNEAPSTF